MENLKEKIEKACEAAGVNVTVQEVGGRLLVDRVKEWKRWKPEFDQKYFYVDSAGFVWDRQWNNSSYNTYQYNTRNCFRTQAEAITKRDANLLKAKILDRVDELNQGWGSDWGTLKVKCFPYYDYNIKIWVVGRNCQHREQQFYLKSKQACQTLIDEFGDDLKVFFHN